MCGFIFFDLAKWQHWEFDDVIRRGCDCEMCVREKTVEYKNMRRMTHTFVGNMRSCHWHLLMSAERGDAGAYVVALFDGYIIKKYYVYKEKQYINVCVWQRNCIWLMPKFNGAYMTSRFNIIIAIDMTSINGEGSFCGCCLVCDVSHL